MRLNPEHVEKLTQAFSVDQDGKKYVKFDIPYMMSAIERLNSWERGLLFQVLLKASDAHRKTLEQRVLLALFVHQEKEDIGEGS